MLFLLYKHTHLALLSALCPWQPSQYRGSVLVPWVTLLQARQQHSGVLITRSVMWPFSVQALNPVSASGLITLSAHSHLQEHEPASDLQPLNIKS